MMLERWRSRAVILLYHRVTELERDPWSMCVTPGHFAEHLEALQQCRRVRLDRLKPDSSFGRTLTVAITFDDGYADNYQEAAPLLDRFDTPATFFVATGYLGGARDFWWNELERIVFDAKPSADELDEAGREQRYFSFYEKLQPLSEPARRAKLDEMRESCAHDAEGGGRHRALTHEELQKLARNPLFEIGAHTVTHPLLAAQPAESQFREISDSRSTLESLLDRPVTSFSYPYGGKSHYSQDSVHFVRELGFSRACTTEAGPIRNSHSRHEWGRYNVTDMDGEAFERFLAGCLRDV